jgi:inner membrane protease ATP23
MADDTSKPPASATERSSISVSHPANDPAKTGYDPASRWLNIFNILLSRMTDEGKDAFREDAYIRNEARDCARCEQWRDYLMEYSPIIRFMSKNISELNGKLDKSNVHCRRCPSLLVEGENGERTRVRQGGGFSPDHGILVCANEMRSQGHLEDTLAHEMVHAWDHVRWKVDWADLRHAACTEVSPDVYSHSGVQSLSAKGRLMVI